MMFKYLLLISCFTFATPGLWGAAEAASLNMASEVYFVRHAETLGNVTHKHTRKNDRTFSTKGKKQVARLTQKLAQLNFDQFDHIVVSPKYRALNTIFPYLKKHGMVAEVWPELEECCWQKDRQMAFSKLKRGSKIKVEAKMKGYFTFADAQAHYRYDVNNYADGMMQTFKAADLIRKRFAGSGKRILVVGHYHSGARLIEMLQGIEPAGQHKLSNAKINYLREGDAGVFELISRNQ